MDILNQIVCGLNKEDLRFYKLFSSRMNLKDERKDIMLLDYIRSSENYYDDEKIFKRLYKYNDRNGFYSLKNRLIHDLCRGLTIQYCFKDNVLYVHHLLFLVRLFFMRNEFKASLHFLRKAESEAKKMENYELLDIIYGEFIKLSHELLHINPEEYINKRNKNRQVLNSIRQVDDILAAVFYRLKVSQNFSEKKNPIVKLLERTADAFSEDKNIKSSPKLKFKIYSAVTQVLLQRHEYEALEKYLLSAYREFVKGKFFQKENHHSKLQMLHYVVNVLFKNKKYSESLVYAGKLYDAMLEHKKMLYANFLFFYYNSLVINYSVVNKDKAISILEELIRKNTLRHTPFYEIFVYLNLSILWFEKSDYHSAIRNLNKLYIHEEFRNADLALKFKISIAELIIRYELSDFDFLETRVNQIKKQFSFLLSKPEHEREKEFISLLKKMMNAPQLRKEKKLISRINQFIRSSSDVLDDTEVINYSSWLNKKISN